MRVACVRTKDNAEHGGGKKVTGFTEEGMRREEKRISVHECIWLCVGGEREDRTRQKLLERFVIRPSILFSPLLFSSRRMLRENCVGEQRFMVV